MIPGYGLVLEISHALRENIGIGIGSLDLGGDDCKLRDDHIKLVGRIPVNPAPIGIRSFLYYHLRAGEIKVLDLCIVIIEDLEQLILQVLLSH